MSTPELLTLGAFSFVAWCLGATFQLAQCRAHRGEDISKRMRSRALREITELPYEAERRRLALQRISGGATHDAPTGVRIIGPKEEK